MVFLQFILTILIGWFIGYITGYVVGVAKNRALLEHSKDHPILVVGEDGIVAEIKPQDNDPRRKQNPA